jgi:hypothetical protein
VPGRGTPPRILSVPQHASAFLCDAFYDIAEILIVYTSRIPVARIFTYLTLKDLFTEHDHGPIEMVISLSFGGVNW